MPDNFDAQDAVDSYLGGQALNPGGGMRASVAISVGTDPDREAEARSLSRQTGLDPVTAMQVPGEARQRAAFGQVDFDAYAKKNPAASRFLSNPRNAQIAHDDIMSLAEMEDRFGYWQAASGPTPTISSTAAGLARSLYSGTALTGLGAQQQLADALGFEALSKDLQRRADDERFQQYLTDPAFESSTARGLYGGGQSVLQMAPALAASAITRNPSIALGVMGFQTEAQDYSRFRGRGATPGEAFVGALGTGAVEVGTEMLPMGFLVSRFGKTGAGEFLKGYLGRELPTEQIATFLQDAIDTAVANPDMTWQDFFESRPEAAYQTALGTLVATGFFTATNTAAERLAGQRTQAQKAQIAAQAAGELSEVVALVKLRQRDPQTFRQFMDEMAQDGPFEDVYVDPGALAQSGIDPDELAKLSPSVAEQYQDAVQSGHDIKIPVGEFAATLAGTPLGQEIIPHLKTDPSGMSALEAEAFMQNEGDRLAEEVDKILKERGPDEKFKTSRDVVQGSLKAQLDTANRFTPDVNDNYATLVANGYAVAAADLGITPEELYQKHPINVQAEIGVPGGFSQDVPYSTVEELQQNLVDDLGADVVLSENGTDLTLGKIVVAEDKRQQGLGTEAMQRITDYADSKGLRVLLSPSKDFGASSVGRLKDFYKRFGFVENKGSNKDFSTRETMIRDPRILYQAKGNQRGAYNPATMTLTLLKASDLSTFLHESGHFFLDFYTKLAVQPDAPQRIKDDLDTALKWFGIKGKTPEARLQRWNNMSINQQREHHEKWAESFERYLLEGKAPSIELQGVFQKFRAWLLNVYTSLQKFLAKNPDAEGLNDDIRRVFDRMLATTEQIKEAESVREYAPLFDSAEQAGMGDDEWRQYQELGIEATQTAISNLESRSLRDMKWTSNARSKLIKAMQKSAEEKRKAIAAEVAAEVAAEPVNMARTFLRFGTIEGEEIEGPHRLDTKALEDLYGTGEDAKWRKLPSKYGKAGVLGKDGLHPDAVAEMFGFTSGDQLIEELINAENPKDKIEGLTDLRMLERYGDLTDLASVERAADEAIHNDARARFVATELNALQKAVGKPKVLAKAAKQYAERVISGLKVKDVKPARYAAAETRAARNAEQHLRKNEIAEAAIEKRNQLINNYATKAAQNAQEEIDKGLRYLGKFNKANVRKAVSADYADQIDALLERFDLRKGTTLKEIARRKSLLDWAEGQREVGIEPNIPEALMSEAYRKSYKEMSVEEFRGVLDTVRQIEHLGRLKNKLLTAQNDRKFDEAKAEIVTGISANAKGKPLDLRTRQNAGSQFVKGLRWFLFIHRKFASMARQMDGFKDGGPVWEYFIRTMNMSGDKEAVMREKATIRLHEMTRKILAGGKLGGKGQFYPSIGMSLNREEKIALALNTGNESNLQRLLDGEGWTMEQVQPVLDTLTEAEADFVQEVWDFFEGYRPEIAAKERRVYGVEPEWIEPAAVRVGGKELRGGYYPVKYDPRRSAKAEQHADADSAKAQMRAAYTSATPRRSFVKSRAIEVKDRPLLYSFDGLYQGTTEVIHDLSWHEWLIDTNRLLRSPALDRAIRTNYGPEAISLIKNTIADIARGEQPAIDVWERSINHIRTGATVAGLGWNFGTALLQPLGLTNSMARIGTKWVGKGLVRWLGSPVDIAEEIYSKSDFMRLRGKTLQREINEIQNRVSGGKGKAREVIDLSMFWMIQKAQLIADIPTWLGQYEKSLQAHGDEAKAIAEADQSVIDAQGGGQTKDLAEIQRGGPLRKLFTNFYSYFNVVYNLNAEIKARTTWSDPLSVAAAARDYMLVMIIPAILEEMLRGVLLGGSDDDEPLVDRLIDNEISYLFGTMVGLREVSTVAQRVAGVNQFYGGYSGPAGLRFFQELDKLGTQVSQGEADAALAKSVINTSGIIFHLPAAQINRTLGGIQALNKGETQNPAVVVTGPPRK